MSLALFTLPWGGLFICSLDQELQRAGTVSYSFMKLALVSNSAWSTVGAQSTGVVNK